MFAGGTSTTTTAMEWTMAELITHPRAMRKLQDEIRAAVGGAAHVTEDHVEPTALNFATPPIGQSPCRSDGTIPKDFIL